MSVRVKICGLKTPETVAAAVGAGANYIGFNFFEPSPRYVVPNVARDLAFDIPPGVIKVALVVNPTLDELDALMDVVPADMIQLHGKESPDQVVEVKARYGLPVMKAIGVADAPDLEKIDLFASVADQLLIDAKPPKNAVLPGGNGITFDWRLISARRWSVPWMLAGGLTPENVAEAIALTGTSQVDVSSGVESAPGVKDDNLIQRFMAAC